MYHFGLALFGFAFFYVFWLIKKHFDTAESNSGLVAKVRVRCAPLNSAALPLLGRLIPLIGRKILLFGGVANFASDANRINYSQGGIRRAMLFWKIISEATGCVQPLFSVFAQAPFSTKGYR
jgi:hypothetical protein